MHTICCYRIYFLSVSGIIRSLWSRKKSNQHRRVSFVDKPTIHTFYSPDDKGGSRYASKQTAIGSSSNSRFVLGDITVGVTNTSSQAVVIDKGLTLGDNKKQPKAVPSAEVQNKPAEADCLEVDLSQAPLNP